MVNARTYQVEAKGGGQMENLRIQSALSQITPMLRFMMKQSVL